ALKATLARHYDALSPRASEEAGQDLIEYGLLAGLLSTIAIAFIVLVGPQLQTLLSSMVSALQTTVGY
ncbi:MAG: hypothetical protein M3Z66_13620, partial [Chloroflexota bacterium]|nr:hypothetical protein [Chloroflexota bacterium]